MSVATAATTARPPRRLGLPGRDARTAYLYIAPALLVMAIITFYPLIFQVYISFTDFQFKNLLPRNPGPEWVGLENYARIVESRLGNQFFNFARMLSFNLWWAFANVVIHVIIGVGVALLLNQPGLKFKRFYRAIFILPVVIPAIIVATVWKNMFHRDSGAINELLTGVGMLFKIPEQAFQIDWLRAPNDILPLMPLAFFALLIANTWLGWPLNSVVATGALQSIPKELYEAADMDGAGPWQKFRNVTLVYLRPAMVPYAIYGFVTTFNLFHLSFFMTGGEPQGKTELLVTQAFRLVYQQREYGIGAAFAVLMFFILLAITLLVNRAAKATASFDQ